MTYWSQWDAWPSSGNHWRTRTGYQGGIPINESIPCPDPKPQNPYFFKAAYDLTYDTGATIIHEVRDAHTELRCYAGDGYEGKPDISFVLQYTVTEYIYAGNGVWLPGTQNAIPFDEILVDGRPLDCNYRISFTAVKQADFDVTPIITYNPPYYHFNVWVRKVEDMKYLTKQHHPGISGISAPTLQSKMNNFSVNGVFRKLGL